MYWQGKMVYFALNCNIIHCVQIVRIIRRFFVLRPQNDRPAHSKKGYGISRSL